MKKVTVPEFRASCSALLERVRRTRQPIRITHDGKVLAEVIPPSTVQNRVEWIESMKDTFEITGDTLSAANAESDWEALRTTDGEANAKGANKLTSKQIDALSRKTRSQRTKR